MEHLEDPRILMTTEAADCEIRCPVCRGAISVVKLRILVCTNCKIWITDLAAEGKEIPMGYGKRASRATRGQ